MIKFQHIYTKHYIDGRGYYDLMPGAVLQIPQCDEDGKFTYKIEVDHKIYNRLVPHINKTDLSFTSTIFFSRDSRYKVEIKLSW